jgi:hypothetical protein
MESAVVESPRIVAEINREGLRRRAPELTLGAAALASERGGWTIPDEKPVGHPLVPSP